MTLKERVHAPLAKATPHPATATKPPSGKAKAPPAMATTRLPTPPVASVILAGAGRAAPAAVRTRPPVPTRGEQPAPAAPRTSTQREAPASSPASATPAMKTPAAEKPSAAAPVAGEQPAAEKSAKAPRARGSGAKPTSGHAAPGAGDAKPSAEKDAPAGEHDGAKKGEKGEKTEKSEKPEPKGAPGGGKDAKSGAAPGGAPGGGGGGGAGAGVRMRMPPPPSGPSPASVGRLKKVQARAGAVAAAQADLPDGGQQTADARKAVTEPDSEATAKAQAELIAVLGDTPKPSPEIEALCERIKQVIRDKRPPDEDALVKADPEAAANDAGNQLNSSVQSDTQKVQGSYDSINSQPAGAAPAKGAELPPAPGAAPTAPLNAASAAPDPVPAKNVSLDADAADSKSKMSEAGMDKPTAQLVQSGPIAEARNAQGELEQTAKEDPAKVLAGQQQTLGKAQEDMAALQQQALAALHAERTGTVKKTASQQHGMVGSEESMRASASEQAKQIFTETQSQVTELLKPLASNAMAEWDAAKVVLTSKFKADLADVKRRVDDRHSGVGGFFTGLWDAVTGLPSWAERDYSAAEKNFGDGVCDRMKQISVKVNTVIATCDALIKSARARIAKIFADLPAGLQEWAKQEQGKFDGKLDALHDQAMAARDSFNKDMAKDASEAVQAVREEVAELRKKAGGLLGRIADAIGRFLDDPIKFIIEGLLELVGIPPASFWALVNKIKKVISDIADDPMKFANNLMEGLGKGFMQFFDNIGTHLFKGFISWLTGGLVGGGVQLPKDFSLKSIITFLLQLMGITWPRIRKILAKHLGEKNVALAEKVYSMVSLLIEKGPEGIYEMIKEKLDPQSLVDQVVQMAVDYMIGAIMKAAAARIVLLFNPVGAIFQALEAIYRVLKWIFQNAARIFALVETVVNGIADILAGNLGGFANAVEKALGMLIAPVIGFIADYLGFGDLPSVIAEKVKSFQEWILGLIEKALVWMIEKGKKLLAAVGIGKKDKDKKGDGLEQVGEDVAFEADGESHHLWVEVSGGNATLMVASKPQTLNQYLAHVARYGPPEAAAKAAEAKALLSKADVDADQLAKLAVKPPSEGDNPAADVPQKQKALSEEENAIVAVLKQVFELMNPLKQIIGKEIEKITRAPYGYQLTTFKGMKELKRDEGFGGADKGLLPRVHVDEAGLVQEGAGIMRYDRYLIGQYRAAVSKVESRLSLDEAPIFKEGSPDASAAKLEASANVDPRYVMGVRAEMEAFIRIVDQEKITARERQYFGSHSADFDIQRSVRGSVVEVLVEYKHWTGKLSMERREVLMDRLSSQLSFYVSDATRGDIKYSILKIWWPAFGGLDSESQRVFKQIIASFRDAAGPGGLLIQSFL